jgi:acetyl-CoA carboxylase carboxyl transferase subunit alpha
VANNSGQERFAYDFELPVIELEKEIRALTEKAASSQEDLSSKIERLERRRDKLLDRTFRNLTAYQRVKLARHPLRPHPMDYVKMLFTEFIELHGDRRFGDDAAIVTGLGRLDEHRVMVAAQRKGKDTREKMAANFGMMQPEGYRKALHKMKLAEKFGLPLICLIDTPGASPAVAAEERGQAMAIAENIFTMAGLAVPIVIVVTGEGCSGGALGIGVGDRFAMLENAYFTVITPEGLSSILWRDGDHAEQAADAMKLTAQDMLNGGIIDTIIPEPLGGAQRDPATTARNLAEYLTRALQELKQSPTDQLLEERYQRYRCLGVFRTAQPPAPAETHPQQAPPEQTDAARARPEQAAAGQPGDS